MNRFWAVREQYDTLAHRRHCQRLASAVAGAIAAQVANGEDVVLVGLEGSPSMGVCVTSSDPSRGGRPVWPDGAPELAPGEGIFIEELRAELGRRGIPMPRVAGVTHALPDHDAEARAGRLDGGSREMSEGDRRSFRIALVADRYVNPPPGGFDGLAVFLRSGLGCCCSFRPTSTRPK